MSVPFNISVVVPVLNEQGNIPTLIRALQSHVGPMVPSLEIILVDDGSTDDTWAVICAEAAAHAGVKGVRLSRNFGHQAALLAGVRHARGPLVVTMDGDMQHPPELIPEMGKRMQETGCDVVNTIRTNGADYGYFKRNSSKGYYRLLNALSDTHVPQGSADFRLMNHKATRAFLAFTEQGRFSRGLVSWMGFKQEFVSYDAPERKQGQTKFVRKRMLHLAIDGLISFTDRPLRLAFIAAFFCLLVGVTFGVYAVVQYFNDSTVPGWTSMVLLVLFTSGVNMLLLGIVGEYVARVLREVKARPLYFVTESTDNLEILD
jgi:dolichol-phosphate mannosyltransferase